MNWFLEKAEHYKEGLFISWIGTEPFVNVFKPEYLEVNKFNS